MGSFAVKVMFGDDFLALYPEDTVNKGTSYNSASQYSFVWGPYEMMPSY